MVRRGRDRLVDSGALAGRVTAGADHDRPEAQPGWTCTHRLARAIGGPALFVFHTESGKVTDPAVRSRMQAMFAQVGRLPHVVGVTDPYASNGQAISKDGMTAFAGVTLDAQANELPKDAISAVIDTAQAARTPTVQVELGGQAITQTQSAGPSMATAAGLGVAVLVLLVLFGSVTAMLTPILTVDRHRRRCQRERLISHLMDMNGATLAIALMIALGVRVDYSLFIVSRFRGLLSDGRDAKEAAVGSVNTSGRAVLFAGSLVVLALALVWRRSGAQLSVALAVPGLVTAGVVARGRAARGCCAQRG